MSSGGSNRFAVAGVGGSARTECTDISSPLDDVVVTTAFVRLGTSYEPYVVVRKADSSPYTGYTIQAGNGTLTLRTIDEATNPVLDSAAITCAASTWYWMKVEATGTTIRAKVWAVGNDEPETWDVSATDSTYSSGGVMLCSYLGGQFDNVEITSPQLSSGV